MVKENKTEGKVTEMIRRNGTIAENESKSLMREKHEGDSKDED